MKNIYIGEEEKKGIIVVGGPMRISGINVRPRWPMASPKTCANSSPVQGWKKKKETENSVFLSLALEESYAKENMIGQIIFMVWKAAANSYTSYFRPSCQELPVPPELSECGRLFASAPFSHFFKGAITTQVFFILATRDEVTFKGEKVFLKGWKNGRSPDRLFVILSSPFFVAYSFFSLNL